MNTLTHWQARQKELEDKYVELMLAKYPLLTDVTTNTQRKNGTRMFELNHKSMVQVGLLHINQVWCVKLLELGLRICLAIN